MSLRRLLAMAFKETLQIWRDPRSLAIALLMPLLQMVLLGYGVSLDIRQVPLCINDEEHSQLSRELVQDFVSSHWFLAVRNVTNERALRDAMDRGTCAGVVTIPVDFSRVFTTTGTASVQTVFDATDANTTNIAIGYAQNVIARTTAEFQLRWRQSHGIRPQTVGVVDLDSTGAAGYELYARLREHREAGSAPVLAVAHLERDRLRAASLGFDEALANPPGFVELQASVLRTLGKPLSIRAV